LKRFLKPAHPHTKEGIAVESQQLSFSNGCRSRKKPDIIQLFEQQISTKIAETHIFQINTTLI
jgi:hypothetical protein